MIAGYQRIFFVLLNTLGMEGARIGMIRITSMLIMKIVGILMIKIQSKFNEHNRHDIVSGHNKNRRHNDWSMIAKQA